MKKTINFFKKMGRMYMEGLYEYGSLMYQNGKYIGVQM